MPAVSRDPASNAGYSSSARLTVGLASYRLVVPQLIRMRSHLPALATPFLCDCGIDKLGRGNRLLEGS